MFRFSILTLLVVLFQAPVSQAQSWNLNDVSYLFPLPSSSADFHQLLNPSQGALIPKVVYQKLPLMDATEGLDLLYEAYRLVAVRIDPCGLRIGSSACDPQVRLVWQVLKPLAGETGYTAIDAGMHSFYRLTPQQMKSLSQALWALKLEGLKQNPVVDTNLLPLGVHPAFRNPTYRGRFQSALQSLILQYCSKKNLIQLTVEQLFPSFVPGSTEPDSAASWTEFSGIQKTGEKWTQIFIPHLQPEANHKAVTVQKIFNDSQEKDNENFLTVGAKFSVLPVQESRIASAETRSGKLVVNLNEVLNGSSLTKNDQALLEGSFQVLRRFQNPKLSNTQNLDCAGCHLASPAEAFLNHLKPGLETRTLTLYERYQNPNSLRYDLSNSSLAAKGTGILRAFGYWRTFPAFNQRVIHESVESAEAFNRLGFAFSSY